MKAICILVLVICLGVGIYKMSGTKQASSRVFYLSSDAEQMPRERINIEEVLDMDIIDIGMLPQRCGADLIYDLCREIERLRAEEVVR